MKHRDNPGRGDLVRVSTFNSGWVERFVVRVEGERVFVATAAGYEAIERGDEADVIGFPRKDVEEARHA